MERGGCCSISIVKALQYEYVTRAGDDGGLRLRRMNNQSVLGEGLSIDERLEPLYVTIHFTCIRA